MSKRIISFLLICAMFFGLLPVIPVTAETATVKPTLVVESKSTASGSSVDVNVSVVNNPGIAGAKICVAFSDKLTLVEAVSGDTFSALDYTAPESLKSSCYFNWDSLDAEVVEDGVLLTLTFEVSEDAEPNEALNIDLSYRFGDIYNSDLDSLEFDVTDGCVTILNYIPGDVNEDGVVNGKDVTLIRRYNAGTAVSFNEAAADVNDDGVINGKDVTLIRRYNAGYEVELKPSTPRCSHTMEYVPYQAPTCDQEGTVAHYYCVTCEKYYNDDDGTTEINQNSTVLAAKGHTSVTDPYVAPTYTKPGWTEGSHCSVCNEVLIAQDEIPVLKSEEYAITYKLPNTDSYLTSIGAEQYNTNPTTYRSNIGIEELEDLEVPGYDFFGWYTEPNGGGQRISNIPADTTGKKTLYAHMTPHVYKITFDTPDVAVTGTKITGESVVNYTEYTVDTGVTLTNPTWYGYTFVGWSNDEGFLVSRILPGTTGNITLHANWTANRNKAVSYSSYGEPIIIEDAENGQFLFVYNIGKIENVPLNEVKGSYFHNMDTTHFSEELAITESIEEGFVDSINKMVSEATTKSSGWTLETGWNDIYTSSEETGSLSEKSDERTTSDGNVVGGKYFVSNSEGGSTHVSTESGSSSSNSAKVTTENSFGINQSYDTSTEKYCDAQLGVKTHLGASNETEVSAGVEVPVPGAKVSAGVKNTTTIESSVDTEMGIQNGRKDSEAYHIDGSVSGYVGTVKTNDSSSYYNSSISSASNWNSQTGYEQSKETSHNESVTAAIKEQLSETTTHSISKALNSTDSKTENKEESIMSAEEYATSLTYSKGSSNTTTKKVETTFTVPGYYRYITAGTVHVYAVVGYDVATASYYTYSFNVLDDNTRQVWDYSKDNKDFLDCENGVVTFDVPYEVNEYISGMVGRTNGLEISYDGEVTCFEPDEKFNGTVVIPQYASKYNHDGTYTAVKVTSIAEEVFENVKDKIEVVILPTYVNEIPDNAFAGCTNLKMVYAYGVTKIGDNAFAGCTSLEKFYIDNAIVSLGDNVFEDVEEVAITAYDSSVAEAAINCGAKKISLNIAYLKDKIDDTVIEVSEAVEYFALIGNGGIYNNVSIKSDAEETMISNMVFANNKGTPIEMTSPKVTFARMTVTDAPGFAVMLKADQVDLKLLGDIKISSLSDNAVISRSVALSKLDQSTTSKMILEGNYLVCGNIANSTMLNFTRGEIVNLTEEEYEAMLTSSVTTFDPNGGQVGTTEKLIYYGQPYGELPLPTRTGYAFDGWYTEKTGGTKVTADTVATVLANQTLYAHWIAKAYNVSWNTGTGYTITVNRTSSPYANAATGALKSGEVVYYGDVLSVTYTASTGYTINSKGSTSITVSGNVTSAIIYATASVNAYTVSWNTGTGYTIAVKRTNSPLKKAATGALNSKDAVYYGDVLEVTYTASTGYSITSKGKTSVTVTGNVTSSDIYATASANNYTYTILYRSSNGTDLGNSTATYKYGTTNTISAPGKTGYNTPGAQSVKWDSVNGKTITFTYTPVGQATSQWKAGGTWYLWSSGKYGITYNAYAEYQNRTAGSVQIRITWQNTINTGGSGAWCKYGYAQYFTGNIGGQSTGEITIAASSLWNRNVYNNETATVSSGWITVPVSATQTSVSVSATYRDLNNISGSWSGSIAIPTY